jgi:hypothetical protein
VEAAREMQPTGVAPVRRDGMVGARASFVALNVLGGVAVLGSYVLWLGNPSNQAGALWGTIGPAGRTLYTVSMFLAAAGYFAFCGYLLRWVPAHDAPDPFPWLNTVFTFILFPSAVWMPLSFEYLDSPTPALWWAIRGTLWVVGASSLALVVALARLEPSEPTRARGWAIAGAVAFAFQTGVLDAFVWPLYFPG